MQTPDFNDIIEAQIEFCRSVLVKKADEYATEDRLHNFRVAATLEGTTMHAALAGMMAKHTVSIYDMCYSDKTYSDAQWDEKITDHLNYLFLLKAVVVDEAYEENAAPPSVVVHFQEGVSPSSVEAIREAIRGGRFF